MSPLPIPGPAIRPVIGSQNLHKGSGTGCSPHQSNPHLTAMLPGRHSDPAEINLTGGAGGPDRNTDPSGPWLHSQFQKGPSDSFYQFSLPGRGDRLLLWPSFSLMRLPGRPAVLSGQDSSSAVGTFKPSLPTIGEDDFMPFYSALGAVACLATAVVPAVVPTSEGRQEQLKTQRESLTQRVLRSLHWWASPALRRGCTYRVSQHVMITSDVSLFGWDTHLQSQVVQGRWSPTELQNSINWLEL